MDIIQRREKAHQDLLRALERKGIETDINKRWENGVEHHPKSLELMEFLISVDLEFCNDYFCWKHGGDGDNGETFMFQLDMYFELMDQE